MTREEAINKLIRIRQLQGGKSEAHEALGMAINALAYQAELPEGLEEAAEKYRRNSYNTSLIPPTDGPTPNYGYSVIDTFKAGAKWDRAKMMERAVEGVVQDDGQFINFGDGRYIDLDPTMENKPVFELTDGDKVKVIVIKEEK